MRPAFAKWVCVSFVFLSVACGRHEAAPPPAAPRAAGSAEAPSPIVVAPVVPAELNAPGGGAPNATPEQAAAFAWNQFIALNWPAGPQAGQNGQRDTPSTTCRFGDPRAICQGPTVWETYRNKVETFPGDGNPPPGYVNDPSRSYGYDALSKYNYALPVQPCPGAPGGPTPFVNLDETDEITLASMFAGVVDADASPGNSSPQLVRFLAKSNRTQYVYVTRNSNPDDPLDQWWSSIPEDVVTRTRNFLRTNMSSPPADSSDMVSNPNGTIEIKAGWRPLNRDEIANADFHTQLVRFYERAGTPPRPCYRDATWGLVALHIIQKTPSAPYFIYATFEQSFNILTTIGAAHENAEGHVIRPQLTNTTPQVCLQDPRPPLDPKPDPGTSTLGKVILTANPSTCQPAQVAYCDSPGKRLYYINEESDQEPHGGNICVDRRANAIPDYVIAANQQAHAAIKEYLRINGIAKAPWLTYKLVNVQYFPVDKVITNPTPDGSLYTSRPPFTAQNPAASSYYLANIMVETNRSLQLFSGGLSPFINSDWSSDGTPRKNTYYGGKFLNMGGCLGCHGSQGQNPGNGAGDFSVILARGSVTLPEVPAPKTAARLLQVPRNRSLTR